jgi:YVTN family beta-propeller protein
MQTIRSEISVGLVLSLGCAAAVVVSLAPRLRAADNKSPSAEVTAAPASERAINSQGGTTSHQRIVHEGIAVDFAVEPVGPHSDRVWHFREGDDVRFRFKISDTATERPVTGAYPAAWMDLVPVGANQDAKSCLKKAAAFLSESLLSKPELDLNAYYVLTLNDDATITVVDPLFGFGGTRLLALLQLKSPGEDWALTSDQARLFVSMPDSNQIAVISTASWQVIRNLDAGISPTRAALQPDGHYLWVATGEAGGAAESGVTVVDAERLEVAAKIPTGAGRHEIAFDDQSRFAFVTNAAAGTVSVIDVRTLMKTKDIPTGRQPTSIAFSSKAQMVYVTNAEDGSIAVVAADRHKVLTRILVEPGLGQVKFAPEGRFGFVINSRKRAVLIIDSATNHVTQTATVENAPDQVAFSRELAYIHHRESATVLMVPLAQVGIDGRQASLADFAGGQNPPGHVPRLSRADAIVRVPADKAVLVANPADKAVYLYEEGMAAPKGSFGNYDRQPRAVLVVDRSLRERSAAGVYETIARLGRPGRYDVVFFLDAPRIAHCFPMIVAERPDAGRQRDAASIRVEVPEKPRNMEAGKQVRIEFKLTNAGQPVPRNELTDVTALAMLAPGVWHNRVHAEVTDGGLCAITFVPPQAGFYYLYLKSPSLGLGYNNLPNVLVLQATDARR